MFVGTMASGVEIYVEVAGDTHHIVFIDMGHYVEHIASCESKSTAIGEAMRLLNPVMGYGKNRGKAVTELPHNYLYWMWKERAPGWVAARLEMDLRKWAA